VKRSTRDAWLCTFLAITALAIMLELLAAFDGDPNTDPWTDLIVKYVPMEVTFAVIGALCAWLPLHFGIRYWRRSRRDSKPQ
jgi:hypothetical protein